MAMRVTHELHDRRKGRNVGLALVLVGFIGIIFGLTVVKVRQLGGFEGFDHVVRPQMIEQAGQ
ncbi:MAG: hypothetical protein AAFR35_00900 [Pseudomonadota bacterium]